jgi:hypothetical protein
VDNIEDTLNHIKKSSRPLTVGEDFESRVFGRIKKKKRQRKIAASAAMCLAVFAFLFTARAVLFHRESEPIIMAQPEPAVREEVPVIEDVIFASSDSRNAYAFEQVTYYEGDNTI